MTEKNDADIYTGSWVIRALSFQFDIRGQVWPQRSKVIRQWGCNLIIELHRKKVDTDIFDGSRVTRSQSFQFDLWGQVDLGGQRSIFVFVENHKKSIPWNFCVDWITLTWVITV